MKRPLLLLSLLLVAPLAGCGSNKLETGYAYTPLGDSSAKRRGYYADPFSPEAQVDQTAQQNSVTSRHPQPGGGF